MDKKPTLLTIREAAERLGVHPKTLRRWTDTGRISYIRLPSGHRRFRAADIEDARSLVAEPVETPSAPGSEMIPQEETSFYAGVAQQHLATARQLMTSLRELEVAQGLPEKERAKVAQLLRQYEKLLPTLERNAREAAAVFERLTGRPFTNESEENNQ